MAQGWKSIGTIGDIDWFLQTVHKKGKDISPGEKQRIRAEHDHRWYNAMRSTYVMPKPHIIETSDGRLIEEFDQQSFKRMTKHQEETEAWWENEKQRRKRKIERNARRRAAKNKTAIPAMAD